MVCLKRPNINKNEAQDGPLKSELFQKILARGSDAQAVMCQQQHLVQNYLVILRLEANEKI